MKKNKALVLSKPCNERIEMTSTLAKDVSVSETAQHLDDSQEPVLKCRYVITIIGFVIYIFTGIQRTMMSVLIVAMVNNTAIDRNSESKSESCQKLIANNSEEGSSHNIQSDGELLWSPEIQGYMFGGYYLGCILTQIPSGRLAEKYGCKWILASSLLVIGIFTILVPTFSWWNVYAAIVVQTLRGSGQGAVIPCMTILITNWSPKNERGFLFSIVLSGMTLGPVFGNIFAGYVSELPGGWPYVFYSVGGVVLFFGVYVLFFVSENPSVHPHISEAELNFILRNQEIILSRKRPNLPWSKVFTSIPIYALIIVSFGRFWMVSQFWIVHSTFLGTILHYPMGENGVFSALPNLVSFLFSQVASWISLYIQKKNVLSVDFLRKFWSILSHLMYSLCLLGMYFAGCDRNLSVIFATFSMGATGLGTLGSVVATQDMSPMFSGTLLAICYTTGYISGVILPLLVGYLTDEMRTLEQWNKVFFISIFIVMSTSIVFLIFGSAKVQPWNFVAEESKEKVEITDEKKREDERNDDMTRF